MTAPSDTQSERIAFDNSYARDLVGTYVPWRPQPWPQPHLLALNRPLAIELGLDADWLSSADGIAVLSGNVVPKGAQPLAQAYAGHQFGGFSPQLGDGRALLLGEVIDRSGNRRDLALKGSGPTPFSRRGDGRAALGPVLREFLLGEAMHALGIPTTRALAAVATGDWVVRTRRLPGAVLTRVAASHLRVGTFEFFAARQDTDTLRRLADHAIARHDPALLTSPQRYSDWLQAVILRQASLIAHWMSVGFIHGVMNTDNMTISGETIDYGPCAFMEAYSPDAVFSSIDDGGRYAYGRQPDIARWNLERLAEAVTPLLSDDPARAADLARAAVDTFGPSFEHHWRVRISRKLGLSSLSADAAADLALIRTLLDLLQMARVDFTQAFRLLPLEAGLSEAAWLDLFGDFSAEAGTWLTHWRARAAGGLLAR